MVCLDAMGLSAGCCLAKGTLVRMADSSNLPIERVQIGDMVCTNNQGMAQVREVLQGTPTEALYCVQCEEAQITVTGLHPFLTSDGWRTAALLGSGDELVMDDGTGRRIVAVTRVDYKDTVYNLGVADPVAGIICNGFVVGDFHRQNANPPA